MKNVFQAQGCFPWEVSKVDQLVESCCQIYVWSRKLWSGVCIQWSSDSPGVQTRCEIQGLTKLDNLVERHLSQYRYTIQRLSIVKVKHIVAWSIACLSRIMSAASCFSTMETRAAIGLAHLNKKRIIPQTAHEAKMHGCSLCCSFFFGFRYNENMRLCGLEPTSCQDFRWTRRLVCTSAPLTCSNKGWCWFHWRCRS